MSDLSVAVAEGERNIYTGDVQLVVNGRFPRIKRTGLRFDGQYHLMHTDKDIATRESLRIKME